MKLQILGTGCPKCKTLEANVKEAIREMNIQAEVVKVTELDDIMNMGVMVTPAFAIDDDVKTSGKLLTKDQIIEIVQKVIVA